VRAAEGRTFSQPPRAGRAAQAGTAGEEGAARRMASAGPRCRRILRQATGACRRSRRLLRRQAAGRQVATRPPLRPPRAFNGSTLNSSRECPAAPDGRNIEVEGRQVPAVQTAQEAVAATPLPRSVVMFCPAGRHQRRAASPRHAPTRGRRPEPRSQSARRRTAQVSRG